MRLRGYNGQTYLLQACVRLESELRGLKWQASSAAGKAELTLRELVTVRGSYPCRTAH